MSEFKSKQPLLWKGPPLSIKAQLWRVIYRIASVFGKSMIPTRSVKWAHENHCCRICGGQDRPLSSADGLILDYGDEYAHESCLKVIGKTDYWDKCRSKPHE